MSSYIFLCTNATEDECFKRSLFGGTINYSSQVKEVNPGDNLFLYNFQSKRLHGIFKAISEAKMDIEQNAWEGDYPWQVKVERIENCKPLAKHEFEDILRFSSRQFPKAKINEDQLSKLIEKFRLESRLPDEESSYRLDNPAHLQTDDGHFVRSFAEVTIDNWLFNQEITHGYERVVPIPELMLCDFFIPIPGTKSLIYIEYWGLEDAKYLKRKEQKQRLYAKYNLPLIELTPKDLEVIDDILPQKLRQYLKERSFY